MYLYSVMCYAWTCMHTRASVCVYTDVYMHTLYACMCACTHRYTCGLGKRIGFKDWVCGGCSLKRLVDW